jgi:hypothetical protein
VEEAGTVAVSRDAIAPWRTLLRLGTVSAIVVVVMIPVQAAVFILSPPPTTVEEFFALFQRNPLLGLLDLDLLLSLDYLLMVPFYLALFVLLRQVARSAALLALTLGLFSVVLFLFSRDATFSMWMVSDQYAAAGSEAQKAALVATGQMLLTLYNGGTFGLSYILGAISTLVFSGAMLRHPLFGRLPGTIGIITGITMLLPPNTGQVGLTVAMLSLVPTAVWLVVLARTFIRCARV